MSLEAIVFPEGAPRPGQLVEIVGPTNIGKSLLLLELATNLVLPVTCGGNERKVLLLDCENTFDLSVILALMEKCILNNAIPSLARTLDAQQIERIQQESLERLYLYQCYSQKLCEWCWWHLDETTFPEYRDIEVVLVDSIATFYLPNPTREHPRHIEKYIRKRCKFLRRKAKKFQKSVIYTKTPYSVSPTDSPVLDPECSPTMEERLTGKLLAKRKRRRHPLRSIPVRYRIELSLANPPPSAEDDEDVDRQFNAIITTRKKRQYERHYLIDDFGFNWIEQQE
ncbi:uncharacterized protein LOC126574017 [Anopheles aquasalis]|uniref:uncharacterized protein LOC126574017 n=1 Tax=Anopheles aquasalis TaxID=42839 RepID=UPI00215AB447|nr:uncharacterized protein LOC126574017 [Anopheles aquasalis]